MRIGEGYLNRINPENYSKEIFDVKSKEELEKDLREYFCEHNDYENLNCLDDEDIKLINMLSQDYIKDENEYIIGGMANSSYFDCYLVSYSEAFDHETKLLKDLDLSLEKLKDLGLDEEEIKELNLL